MNYIGFSQKTHKLYAKILCKKFRHCAPVIVYKNKCVIYQFVRSGHIKPINIKPRDLGILERHGWVFIKYNKPFNREHIADNHAITCVQFTKSICKIKARTIQTPDALLKHINKI